MVRLQKNKKGLIKIRRVRLLHWCAWQSVLGQRLVTTLGFDTSVFLWTQQICQCSSKCPVDTNNKHMHACTCNIDFHFILPDECERTFFNQFFSAPWLPSLPLDLQKKMNDLYLHVSLYHSFSADHSKFESITCSMNELFTLISNYSIATMMFPAPVLWFGWLVQCVTCFELNKAPYIHTHHWQVALLQVLFTWELLIWCMMIFQRSVNKPVPFLPII